MYDSEEEEKAPPRRKNEEEFHDDEEEEEDYSDLPEEGADDIAKLASSSSDQEMAEASDIDSEPEEVVRIAKHTPGKASAASKSSRR